MPSSPVAGLGVGTCCSLQRGETSEEKAADAWSESQKCPAVPHHTFGGSAGPRGTRNGSARDGCWCWCGGGSGLCVPSPASRRQLEQRQSPFPAARGAGGIERLRRRDVTTLSPHERAGPVSRRGTRGFTPVWWVKGVAHSSSGRAGGRGHPYPQPTPLLPAQSLLPARGERAGPLVSIAAGKRGGARGARRRRLSPPPLAFPRGERASSEARQRGAVLAARER